MVRRRFNAMRRPTSLEGARHPSLTAQPMIGFGWLAAIIGLTIYGSLLPFRFQSNMLSANNGFGLLLITWYPSTIEDFVTNLLVYAVLGFVVFSVMRNNRYRVASALMSTLLIGALISVLVESCQSATATRVASWLDVTSDIVGMFLGASVAWTASIFSDRLGTQLRYSIRAYPYSTLALGITLALCIFHLFPFDFVHSTSQMKTVFLRADWQILAMIHPAYWLTDPQSALSHLESAGWFSLLGYMFFVGRMEHSNSRGQAMISTLRHGFILVVVIEFLQLLTMSHVFESTDIIIRCLATTLGASLALSNIRPTTTISDVVKPAPIMSKTLLLAAIGIQATVLLFSAYLKGKANHWDTFESASFQLPFMALWQSSLRVAMGELMSIFVCYSCLSWPLVTLMRRMRIIDAGIISGCLIVFVACRATMFEQGASLFTQDFTTPILAVLIHMFVFRAMDYMRSSMGSRGYGDLSSLLTKSSRPSAHIPIA